MSVVCKSVGFGVPGVAYRAAGVFNWNDVAVQTKALLDYGEWGATEAASKELSVDLWRGVARYMRAESVADEGFHARIGWHSVFFCLEQS